MSLSRVRELAAAGADGSIRPDELRELWALLPEVVEMAEALPKVKTALRAALDEWEYASQYKGEFLAKKHGDAEGVADGRKVLDDAP